MCCCAPLDRFIGVIMSSLEVRRCGPCVMRGLFSRLTPPCPSRQDARKHLTHEWNAEEAEKREQQKTSKLPSFLQGKGRRHSFVGSALDKPSEFDEQREATERLIEMRDVVAKVRRCGPAGFSALRRPRPRPPLWRPQVKDDVGYVRTVELDRWVRREEYRVHQNIIKLRKVKQLARGVAALGGARKRRRGSMVARLAPSSPEGSLMRAGAKVRRASFGSVRDRSLLARQRGGEGLASRHWLILTFRPHLRAAELHGAALLSRAGGRGLWGAGTVAEAVLLPPAVPQLAELALRRRCSGDGRGGACGVVAFAVVHFQGR